MISIQYLHKLVGATLKKRQIFQENALRHVENHGQTIPNQGMGAILTNMGILKNGN